LIQMMAWLMWRFVADVTAVQSAWHGDRLAVCRADLRDLLNNPHESRFERKSLYGRRKPKSVPGSTVEAFEPQRAIFAEILRDAPILPARFVAALARCTRIDLRAAPAGSRQNRQRRDRGDYSKGL